MAHCGALVPGVDCLLTATELIDHYTNPASGIDTESCVDTAVDWVALNIYVPYCAIN